VAQREMHVLERFCDDVSITQVTVGVVDKQSALAKLDEWDHQTILSPTG